MSEDDPWMTLLTELPGGDKFVGWDRAFQVFHDGRVLSLDLNSQGHSTLTVQSWKELVRNERYKNEVYSSRGCFIVRFHMEDVVGCGLRGFNSANLIHTLCVVRAAPTADPTTGDARTSGEELEIQIETNYGLQGYIRTTRISVEIEFCEPTG